MENGKQEVRFFTKKFDFLDGKWEVADVIVWWLSMNVKIYREIADEIVNEIL